MALLFRFLSFVGLLTLIFYIGVALVLHVDAGIGGPKLVVASAILVLGLFTLPVTGLYLWWQSRIRQIEHVSGRVRSLVGGESTTSLVEEGLYDELADLARILEQWRGQMASLSERYEKTRALSSEIFDAIGEGLLAIDRDRRIVMANRRLAEMVDLRSALVGRPFHEVIRSAQLVTAFDLALAGEATSYRDRVEIGGRARTIEVRVFPARRFSDAAAVALLIDVSLIERLERIRRDFVADFSHEVRTPMAGLRSAIESFEAGELSEEHESKLRAIVSRQLGRLERLVRDLSELNAIESGDLVLRPESLDLRELLAQLAQDMGSRSPAGVHVEGEGVGIVADRLRIEQIFSNLIDNAVKYGGTEVPIVVDIRRLEGEAVVRVVDRGPGIPPKDLDRIFNRFYRVDRSRSQVAGTGLGLAITKHLVQLHRGSIRATSELDRGATFEVRLPCARAD